MIETLGGEVVEYSGARVLRASIITMNRETSLRQAGTYIEDALDAGADCLVTLRPLCHLNLDMQQPEAAKITGLELGLAVLHLPQLVGLALAYAEAARDGAHRFDRVGRGAALDRRGLGLLARCSIRRSIHRAPTVSVSPWARIEDRITNAATSNTSEPSATLLSRMNNANSIEATPWGRTRR